MGFQIFSRSELMRSMGVFRSSLWALALLSMLANLLMLSPTIYMLQVYDRVLVSRSGATLVAVSAFTLVLFAIMAVSEWLRGRLLIRTGLKLDQLLGTRVFNASFEAQLNQSDQTPQKAFADLIEVRQFVTANGIFAFFDVPWTPIYIAVLFFLHPVLGGVAIAFALIQGGLAWFGHHQALAPSKALAESLQQANQFLQGKLRNAEVVESMGMLSALQQRWAQRHHQYLHQHALTQGRSHRLSAVSKWVRYTQQSLGLAAGALLVVDGQLSPGAMIASNVLLSRALSPIDMLVGGWRGMLSAVQAFGRLEALLEKHPERDTALQRVAPTGQVDLRAVQARVPGLSQAILKGIDLSCAAGQVVVVMGPSGSGKSTLARVLVGVWPDVSGEVLLDGMPLADWNRIDLGPHIGYLPQDIELFQGSIAENIARFAEVDSDKVIAASRTAGLHDMILRLPKGYDTPMGEAGNRLSGGQKQRIALARALYGSPSLLVLDEPNANLDDAGEKALLDAVQQLKAQGKTVWLISHRPSVVRVADQLVLLREGQVVAAGPRDAVLAQTRAQSTPEDTDAPTSHIPAPTSASI